MHIHAISMSVQSASLYSTAQQERAAASQRAAELRKRLLKGAQSLESASSPEESLMINQWMDGRHSQVLSGDEYRAAASGKDPDFG
jgi:hypothetical protein